MATAIEHDRETGIDAFDLLARTSDGMVAVAPGGAILAWNQAAHALLGYSEAEALGRQCHQVLSWADRCGNPVCAPFCPLRRQDEESPLSTRTVVGRSKNGATVWLSVTTLLPPPRTRERIGLVHLFREIALPPALERVLAARLQPQPQRNEAKAAALAGLTAREREVLALIAQGADSAEIARTLFLSIATVRNHVQNILRKLGVRNRLQATVCFLQNG